MSKFYRATRDSFLWKEGAILEQTEGSKVYRPIDDLWNVTEDVRNESITAPIIEHSPEWFERVYKNKFDKFLSKAEAIVAFKDKMTT